jgi:hypothetical protein
MNVETDYITPTEERSTIWLADAKDGHDRRAATEQEVSGFLYT